MKWRKESCGVGRGIKVEREERWRSAERKEMK
jgi:hypothetical protein